MALEIAAGIENGPASAGDQILTVGFETKFLFVQAIQSSDDGFRVGAGAGWGMASSATRTNQFAIGWAEADNNSPTLGYSGSYDGVVMLPIEGNLGDGISSRAYVSAISSTTVTLTWTDVQARIIWLALGGDIEAEVGRFAANTSTGAQSRTVSLSGTPLAVLLGIAGGTSLANTAHWRSSLGAATSSSARWGLSSYGAYNQTMSTAADGERSFRTDAVLTNQTAGATFDAVADFTSLDATPGFTINWSDAPAAANIVGYAAFRGVQIFCGSSAKPTGAAPQNQDFSCGFTPKAAIVAHAEKAAGTTITNGGAIFCIGCGIGSTEGSVWSQRNDAVNTDCNHRFLSGKILTKNTAPSTSAAEADADFTGVADTLRLVWNPNDANAHTVGVLAFGDPAGGNATVTPGVLTLTSAVRAPTVTTTQSATVTPAALTAALAARPPTPGVAVTPAALTASLALRAPTVAASATVTPAALSLALTLPTAAAVVATNATVTPNVLTLAATVQAPTVGAAVTPAAQTAATALGTPTVTGTALVTPAALSLAVTLPAATVSTATNATVTPSVLTAALALGAPTVAGDAIVAPAASSASLSLIAPSISTGSNATVTPAALSATLSLIDPSVSVGGNATVTPGALTATLVLGTSTVAGAAVVATTATSASLSLPAPSISTATNATVSPSALSAALSLGAPTVTASALPTPSVLTATFAVRAPVVSTGGNVTVSPSALVATLAVRDPGVAGATRVTPAALTLTVARQAPTIGVSVTPSQRTVTVSPVAPTISTTGNAIVAPAAASATFALPFPTVTAGQIATVTPGALSASLSVPTAAAAIGAQAEPAAFAATFSVPSPTVDVVSNILVSVGALALVLALPTPVVTAVIQQFIGTVRVDTVAAYSVRVGNVRVASLAGAAP